MDQQAPSRTTTFGVGAIAAVAGLYFILVALGILPPPGGRNPHGPFWIVFCAGLAFLLGGISVIAHAIAGEAARQGEPPPSPPRWLRVSQYFIGLTIVGCLAAIATWIAFGAGVRSFSVSAPFFETSGGGETFGRIVFGIGAVMTWLALLALAIGGARKLKGRRST